MPKHYERGKVYEMGPNHPFDDAENDEFMALTDQWLAERMIGSPSWGELAEAQGWAEANMGKGL
jgi:hypothetical protein